MVDSVNQMQYGWSSDLDIDEGGLVRLDGGDESLLEAAVLQQEVCLEDDDDVLPDLGQNLDPGLRLEGLERGVEALELGALGGGLHPDGLLRLHCALALELQVPADTQNMCIHLTIE